MPIKARILQMMVAVALLIALAIAPAYDAVKHGPAAYLMELEHAEHHARQGDPAAHGHHNMDDHDHTVVVILPAGLVQPVQFAGNFAESTTEQVSDTGPQLPRRPPRA